jgi:hypothetical protein
MLKEQHKSIPVEINICKFFGAEWQSFKICCLVILTSAISGFFCSIKVPLHKGAQEQAWKKGEEKKCKKRKERNKIRSYLNITR